MPSIRRNLRFYATLWLLSQATTLGAFARQQCCIDRAAAPQKPGCHEAAPPPCPMRHAAGRPCPMHGHAGAADASREDETCRLRGSCSVPLDALAAVLSQRAVLIEPFALASTAKTAGVVVEPRDNTVGRRSPPDSPPPRA